MPRREDIFRNLKKYRDSMHDCHSAGIRLLCPTRWTVRADALTSIISNSEVLLQTWEEAIDAVNDTETKARINGVLAQMLSFEFVFSCHLGEMVLRHTDNLSAAIKKKTSADEGQRILVANLVVVTLQHTRNQDAFDLFWMKDVNFAKSTAIGEPQCPRKRKRPKLMMVTITIFTKLQNFTIISFTMKF